MSDQVQNQNLRLEIQRVYVKDISLESPGSPAVFKETTQPDISLDMEIQKNTLEEKLYEVILKVTVSAKSKEKTIFLAEVHQAGIFYLEGFGQDQLDHVLNAYLPSVLFPYAREVVSDLVNRASFPQLILAPVNFDAMYLQRKKGAAPGAQPETRN